MSILNLGDKKPDAEMRERMARVGADVFEHFVKNHTGGVFDDGKGSVHHAPAMSAMICSIGAYLRYTGQDDDEVIRGWFNQSMMIEQEANGTCTETTHH